MRFLQAIYLFSVSLINCSHKKDAFIGDLKELYSLKINPPQLFHRKSGQELSENYFDFFKDSVNVKRNELISIKQKKNKLLSAGAPKKSSGKLKRDFNPNYIEIVDQEIDNIIQEYHDKITLIAMDWESKVPEWEREWQKRLENCISLRTKALQTNEFSIYNIQKADREFQEIPSLIEESWQHTREAAIKFQNEYIGVTIDMFKKKSNEINLL